MSIGAGILFALAIGSAMYWLIALVLVGAFALRRAAPARSRAPVSVLKPLCGVEDNLYENLRSFCDQDYPSYQVLFGVRRGDDPAASVVRRLIKEYPARDLALVVSDQCLGTNPKVSLLDTLSRRARYDTLVIADSDIRVGREYLNAVVSPLVDRRVGLVTCLYKGMPTRGVWSVLGAMFINEWFFPSAVVATTFGRIEYAFGATIACRRTTLTAIGGFDSLVHDLADDYVLGARVARQGLRVVVAPYLVETVVADRTLTALWAHELRWARTLRAVRPVGYLLSAVTYGLPLSLLFVAVSGVGRLGVAVLAIHLILRLVTSYAVGRVLDLPRRWLMVLLSPARDTLSLVLWLTSFTGRAIRWRGQRYWVDREGKLHRYERSSEESPRVSRLPASGVVGTQGGGSP